MRATKRQRLTDIIVFILRSRILYFLLSPSLSIFSAAIQHKAAVLPRMDAVTCMLCVIWIVCTSKEDGGRGGRIAVEQRRSIRK